MNLKCLDAIHLHSLQQVADLAIVEHPDFNIVRDENGRLMIEAQISNKRTRFKLEQIVELVLQNAKRRAENTFEKLVEKALIVVEGNIANYAFVGRIGKDIGIFKYIL